MYLDPSLLTAGALRLVQLLLNPFIMAGLQSAANPNNGLPYTPAASMAPTAPPRQFSGSAEFLAPFGSLSSMGSVQAMGPMAPAAAMAPAAPPVSTGAGSMTVASMPPYAPWLFGQPLPAVPSTPTGPLYVPPSAVPSLLSSSQAPTAPTMAGQQSSLAAGALSVLEQAIAPYTNGAAASASSSSASPSAPSDDTASPMPMHTLLSLLSTLTSGIRVVVVNFMASFAMMGVVQVVRLVVQNLPIILNVLGLSRASMARVIVDGVTRGQCLERAACVLGRHASTYPSTPDVLRWLRSPDPAAAMPEHPVWSAFRAAAEGGAVPCEAFSC